MEENLNVNIEFWWRIHKEQDCKDDLELDWRIVFRWKLEE
jgi:hypothetical protein